MIFPCVSKFRFQYVEMISLFNRINIELDIVLTTDEWRKNKLKFCQLFLLWDHMSSVFCNVEAIKLTILMPMCDTGNWCAVKWIFNWFDSALGEAEMGIWVEMF